MMSDNGDIAWLSVNIIGTQARVELLEMQKKGNYIPDEKPHNVVAEEAGEIVYIDSLEGDDAVKVGQYVQKGEMLISGIVGCGEKGFKLVHARGSVKAKVEYKVIADIKEEIKLINISSSLFFII